MFHNRNAPWSHLLFQGSKNCCVHIITNVLGSICTQQNIEWIYFFPGSRGKVGQRLPYFIYPVDSHNEKLFKQGRAYLIRYNDTKLVNHSLNLIPNVGQTPILFNYLATAILHFCKIKVYLSVTSFGESTAWPLSGASDQKYHQNLYRSLFESSYISE